MTTEPLVANVPAELKARLIAVARARGCTVDTVVIEYLTAALETVLIVNEEPTLPEVCV